MKKESPKTASVTALIGGAYLAMLGTALPLTVHSAYFDVTRTKALVFWVLGGILAAAAALLHALRREDREKLAPLRAEDVFFAVFALCQIVSTLVFRGAAGLLAADNRYQGVLSFALYLCVFLLLRRGGGLCSGARFGLLLGPSLAAAICILNYFGADPLGLRAVTPEEELPRFMSTVGNISFLSALFVLTLPLPAFLAISADRPRDAVPLVLCALLALWGGMAARAESFVLGALAFLTLCPIVCREAALLRRIPLLWGGTAAAAGIFAAAARCWGLYRLSDLTRLICEPWLLAAVVLVSAALRLFLRKGPDRRALMFRKVYIIIILCCLAAGLVLTVLANTVLRGSFGGTLGSVLVFSPSWGTDRGAVWAAFWEMFKSSGPLQKLIGSGAGAAAEWDRAHRVFSDAVTDNAHNEYLHYLLSAGIIGLMSYLAVLVLAARRALRGAGRTETALLLACAAYAVQAAVNIAQPFTTPLFFAMLALLCAESRENDGQRVFGDAETFSRVLFVGVAAALLIAAAAAAR